jgi:hypothetical protein
MRVDLLTPIVEVQAEQRGLIELEILNDSTVIEQYVCEVPALSMSSYETTPIALTLFPGESGRLAVALSLPRSFPMGVHEFTLVVSGRMVGERAERSVEVRVRELFDMAVGVNPRLVTGRSKGTFWVDLDNKGNAPAEMVVRASDDANKLTFRIEPEAVEVQAGHRRAVQVLAKGRRPFFGAPAYRKITVTAEHLPEVFHDTTEFRQKARLTTGMLTALMLGLIIAAWAFGLLFAARAAFGSDPPRKTVAEQFATGVDVGALDPSAIGASLTGTVTAESTGAPLGRITVELYSSKARFVTAIATGPDGVYRFERVLPGRYLLRFRGPGFDERWYKEGTGPADSEPVTVPPLETVAGLDVSVPGGSGSLTVTVIAADGATVPVTVEVTPADLPDPVGTTYTATTGTPLVITGLATPATYRISATSPQYQTAEITQVLEAGAAATTNPIRLTASGGSISGSVVDLGGVPLGDVTVTTTVDGKPVTTLTPTDGAVGSFVFNDLPTPATYVLEFTRPGFEKVVTAVRLEAGGSAPPQQVVMGSATGTISGVVSAVDVGLGGVTIEVTGGGFVTSVTSFTSSPPGSFVVTGVPVPGEYVLTLSSPGKVPASIAVTLTSAQPSVNNVTVDLLPAVGRVFGRVVDGLAANSPIGGAIVEVSDGQTVRSTVTSNAGAGIGGFEVTGLPPGTYTVTASFGDRVPVTYLVRVDVNPEKPGTLLTVVLGG